VAGEGVSDSRSALGAAAELLGWDGVVLPELELLGERVCVIASIDEREHQRRRGAGVGVLADPWLLEVEEGPSRSAGSPLAAGPGSPCRRARLPQDLAARLGRRLRLRWLLRASGCPARSGSHQAAAAA
jgi:hypothetical protein